MGTLIEIIIDGFKKFGGEIVAGVLIFVALGLFPSLKKFFRRKDDSSEEIRQIIEDALKNTQPQELAKQIEAQRQEQERIKAELQRQQKALKHVEPSKPKRRAMSDEDFVKLCRDGEAYEVVEAINSGANVNAKSSQDWTALNIATVQGHADVVEVLLNYGANVNTRDSKGFTALMFAASNGHTEAAEVLLKHGADVNAETGNGKTALTFAAMTGAADVAEVLLKHGADVNAEDNDCWTALMRAATSGHTEIAKLLRDYGAE